MITDPMPASERRNGGGVFWAALVGGLVAGAIGYLAAYYSEFGLFERTGDTAVSDALAGQEARIDEIEALIGAPDANEERLAASEQGLAGITETVDGFDARLSGVEESLAGLPDAPSGVDQAVLDELDAASQARMEEVSGRVGTIEGDLTEVRSGLDDVQAGLSDLRQSVASDEGPTDEDLAAIGARIDDVSTRLDEQRTALAEAESAATAEANRINAASAVAEIRAALENGSPFADAVGTLGSTTDAEVPAGLADAAGDGVTPLNALQSAFPDAARHGLSASIAETAGDGPIDRFGAFLKSQTGARSISETAGSGPDAILSRAEARLGEGDLAAAMLELDALPDTGKEAMSDWIGRARTRLDATSGLGDLSQTLTDN